jgi:oxygen-independent coproporphyrinogen-3 oxidase
MLIWPSGMVRLSRAPLVLLQPVFSDDNETLRRKVLRGLVCRQRIPADQLTDVQRDDWLLPLIGQGFAVEENGEYLLTEVGRSVLPHIWTDSSPVFRTI